MKTGSIIRGFAKKLVKTIKQQTHILVYIKGSPDPDVMAASFALKWLCERQGTKATIYSPLPPSLPQNSRMIKDLDIPILFGSDMGELSVYDSYAVLDHPSVEVQGITGVLPCVIHVDHHETAKSQVPVACRLVIEETGSTSGILVLVLKELEPESSIQPQEYQRLATALYFGIKTDTDGFQLASEADHRAIDHIFSRVNINIIKKIDDLPLSKKAHQCLTLAIKNQVITDEWLVAGLGTIDGKNRDTIAVVADFLIKREDISKVMIYALVKRKRGLVLDVSIRTREKRFNLNAFIKKITPEGGARAFKGGYQVNLDYFVNCPDPDLVWKVVSMTTIETLRRLAVPKKKHLFERIGDRIKKRFRSVLGRKEIN